MANHIRTGPTCHARASRPIVAAFAALATLAALAAFAALATPAHAQEPQAPAFGPVLVIETIEILGNVSTATRLIRRALPIREGDTLRAGDPRLQRARYKVLALGFFRDVELTLRKGGARGHVVLTVTVKERGTTVLNNLFFGTSTSSAWWAGLDLTERNFFGTGLGLGGGLVYAGAGDIVGARDQWAGELRLSDTSILGTSYGAHGALLRVNGSEPFRVRGDPSDPVAGNFEAFDYTRTGGRAGLAFSITTLSHLNVNARAEHIRAAPPANPTRELPDGAVVPVALDLLPGTSRVITLSLGFDHDTRPDPILPFAGTRTVVLGELGATWMGGSYNYATALAKHQRWWPVSSKRHVLSIHLTGGVVIGDAPRFDRLHAGDFNRLLTPRAFGMVVSAETSPDFLGTGANDIIYGEIGASAVLEYSYRLFRDRYHVYGGDLFVGAGLVGLGALRDDAARTFPLDVMIDAGLRIDTEIAIFELTLANALGRVQF